MKANHANEIILYQPDDTFALDVRVEDESVPDMDSNSYELERKGQLRYTSYFSTIDKLL